MAGGRTSLARRDGDGGPPVSETVTSPTGVKLGTVLAFAIVVGTLFLHALWRMRQANTA